MNKQLLVRCIVGLCVVALTLVHAQAQVAPIAPTKLRRSEGAIPNHYIVVFKDSVASRQVAAQAEQLARTFGGRVGFIYEHALRGFSVELNEAEAEALSRNPLVAYVEEDAEVMGAETQASAPWQLDRLDQRALPLNNSYTYAGNGAGVNVYVIDSGIRTTHQEFKNADGTSRAFVAQDLVGDGQNGNDCYGHGTHAAALIGGNTYGVAKGARLYAVRVLNCVNQGTTAHIIAGVDWVTANHVKPAVANLSFISIGASDTIDTSVRNSIAAGVTYVVAAGNNNIDAGTRSPARVAEAITVAASDSSDAKASFSNYGAVVDVFAPGVDITSAWATDDAATSIRSGTSSAAPLVAGVAARYLSANPGAPPDAVAQAIKNNATAGKVTGSPAGTTDKLLYNAITISDDFNDNARDTTRWNIGGGSSGVTILEQNQRLEITPPASATGYDGYYSATTCDLTNSRVSVEVVRATNQSYGAETYFMLADGDNYLLFDAGGGNFVLQDKTNGVVSRAVIPYDPAQHHFWRFRHDAATDMVYWETSTDAATWVVQRQIARSFSLATLQVQLLAGKYTATTDAGTAIFDNLWHEPNPLAPVALGDDFNDNTLDPAQWTVGDTASPVVVSEQNQQLQLTLQPSTAAYNNVTSAAPFDFKNKTVQVELPQPSSQAGWTETYFELVLDGSNYYLIDVGAGSIVFDAYTNGVRDRTLGTYTPSAHRFLRFRQDAGAGTVNFETSGDGVTWQTNKTVQPTFALSSMKAVLGAGAWGTGNAAPGTAVFDNFRVLWNKALFPQSDNFNDNTQDTTRWAASVPTGMTVAEQNQHVEITPPPDTTGYGSYYSVNSADLTDARATVEVVQSTAPNYGIETYFELSDPANGNYLLFATGGGNLLFQEQTNGAMSRIYIPYDPAQHRFWRFRHNRTNDTIVWETSADGLTWTVRRTMARSFPVTNLQTQLVAGKYTATTPTSTAIFDNVKLERND